MDNLDALNDYGFLIKWEESTDFIRSLYCTKLLIEDIDTEVQIYCVFTIYISDSLNNSENYSYDLEVCELKIMNLYSKNNYNIRLNITTIKDLIEYLNFYK
jgi:hypothetical protein